MCALLLQATCVFLTSSVIALIWKKSLFNIQGMQTSIKECQNDGTEWHFFNLTVNYGLFQNG